MTEKNAPMNTLKPQPGQYDSYHPKFHPLPGEWAKHQLASGTTMTDSSSRSEARSSATPIQKALAAEREQHEYWEKWQGVTPGKPVYEDPRAFQNTLLPTAKYGTEGRGY
jgi:hypothetical protein